VEFADLRFRESDQPVVCPTCEQTFQPFSVYMHTCRVWSCSFLSTPRLAVDIVLDRAVAQEFSVCRYCCSKIWYWPNSGVRPIESLKEEVEHLVVEHRYRSCEQDRFSSVGAFYAHLLTDHGADSPMVEMQDLLDACQGTFCDFELTKAAPI